MAFHASTHGLWTDKGQVAKTCAYKMVVWFIGVQVARCSAFGQRWTGTRLVWSYAPVVEVQGSW